MRNIGIMAQVILTIVSAMDLTAGGLQADAAQEILWAAEIKMVKGHLVASAETYRLGEVSLAKIHAGHPVLEHYAKHLKPPLLERDQRLEEALEKALHSLSGEIRPMGEITTYEAKIEEAFGLLDRALETLVSPNVREQLAFQGEVLTRLLEKIGEEYGEAVEDGKVVNLLEYQDAFGFFQRAKAFFQALEQKVKAHPSKLKELHQLLTQLDGALPAVMPPKGPIPPKQLQAWITSLTSLMKEMTGTKPDRK